MIKFSKVAIATAAALTLVACGDNDSDSVTIIDTPVEYEVLLKNLTNGQPISAPLLILHDTGELQRIIQNKANIYSCDSCGKCFPLNGKKCGCFVGMFDDWGAHC